MSETKAEYLERMDKLGIERHVALRWREEKQTERREQILEDIVSDLLGVDRKLIDYHQAGGDARWLRQHFDPLISKAEVELLGDEGGVSAHQRERSK